MRRSFVIAGLVFLMWHNVRAHDPNASITWNREVSRIVFDRCASCHREEGTSFSLTTYQQAQPRAAAIKDAVLSRRMPPWGAVKGFGDFRNDQGLTQQQIALITDWVEGGSSKGNNPNALPPLPKFDKPAPVAVPANGIPIRGEFTLATAILLDGVFPDQVPRTASIQIVAALPNGAIEPLLWLYEYRDSYRHPFLFRRVVRLPAGTVIRGVPPDARVLLLPAANSSS
jgi:hypothetical protein